MKKLLSITLVLILALTMSVTAFAEDYDDYIYYLDFTFARTGEKTVTVTVSNPIAADKHLVLYFWGGVSYSQIKNSCAEPIGVPMESRDDTCAFIDSAENNSMAVEITDGQAYTMTDEQYQIFKDSGLAVGITGSAIPGTFGNSSADYYYIEKVGTVPSIAVGQQITNDLVEGGATPTALPSGYADKKIDQDTDFKAGNTDIELTVAPTYTVTIPTNITVENAEGSYTGTADITADAGMMLNKGSKVVVTIDNSCDFTLTSAEGAELAYTVNGLNAEATDKTVATFVTKAEAQTVALNVVAGNPEFAGEYSGTVTFNIAVVEAPL